MDKGYMEVHMPKSCFDCKYSYSAGGIGYPYGQTCRLTGRRLYTLDYDITTKRHDSCPLKRLPTKMFDGVTNVY